jgi:hypothetical protein
MQNTEPTSSAIKRITLLKEKPATAISVCAWNNTDHVFYFDRADWKKELEKVSNKPEEQIDYMNMLDSLQKLHGFVPLMKLNSHGLGIPGINALPVSCDIFTLLLEGGKTYVQYSNGTVVTKLKIVKEKTRTGYIKNYVDEQTNKNVYHFAYTTTAPF